MHDVSDASMPMNLADKRKTGSRLPSIMRTYGVVVTLGLLVAVVTAGNPAFLSPTNLGNLLAQWAPAGIMAAGMTFVILTGGFDLSIASGYSLAAVVAAIVGQRFDPLLAFTAAIAAGVGFGLANGMLVAIVRINPFITTVGTGFILNGIALLLTQNAAFLVSDPRFAILGTGSWYGLRYPGMILIGCLVVLQFALSWTVYGQSVYAVGGNYEASRLSGIRVNLVVLSTYVLLGICIGVAGSLTASQLSSAQTNMDPSIIFDVLTIVVVGGTSLAGGSGSIWGTAVGIGIIATISNGFVLLNINPYYQDVIKGGIIVSALVLDVVLARLGRQSA
jgi:ribose transport system permease protein